MCNTNFSLLFSHATVPETPTYQRYLLGYGCAFVCFIVISSFNVSLNLISLQCAVPHYKKIMKSETVYFTPVKQVIKSYQFPLCSYSTKTACHLKIPIRTHTRKKPYSCEIMNNDGGTVLYTIFK